MINDSLKAEAVNVGDVVEVTTERLAYGGEAVARLSGLAIFVPFAAPGERLRVRIVERKKNFARAVIEDILVASPARREPACRVFGECGGCQLQHLTYEAQIEAKANSVRDALERVGRIDWPQEIKVRKGSEFGYRARAQVKLASLARDGSRERAIGFNRASSHTVCDVCSCPILAPQLNDALQLIRLSVGNASVNADSAFDDIAEIEMAVGESGVSAEPPVPGLNSGIVELNVRGAAYHFSPATFFQVNPGLMDELIEEAVGGLSGELAIDLYAGVGLFTIQLARQFDKVIGVESDKGASRFARENIRANDLFNVQFYNARVEDWLASLMKQKRGGRAPDLITLDPPRSGAANAIPKITALSPANISYVSCDPTTLARDLRHLIDAGYELQQVTAIDLFPQTYHIETVARLNRR
jgi:23S rRNA (uracil1939-C5)-methyltransferase